MIQSTNNNHSSISVLSEIEEINNNLAFGISTTVESALQINLFMQNKANFRKSQMNANTLLTVDYENQTLSKRGKNKPNTNPIKAKTNPIKANKMPKQTQYKPKQTQFQKQKHLVFMVTFWLRAGRAGKDV